jgi:hypothetical protein
MTTSELIQSLTKLLTEVVWCRPIEPLINLSPVGAEIREIARKEDDLRNRILPLLHELEHNAFDVLKSCFSKKVPNPLAPQAQMWTSQYAERCAWGISVIAQYLDETYREQIEQLTSLAPQTHGREVRAYLETAANRLP